jgi:hypothetical protein
MRRVTLMLAPVCFGVVLLAAPFWQKKDFSQWTVDDARKMLSDSPWAKTVTLNLGKMTMRTDDDRDAALSSSSSMPPAARSLGSVADSRRAYAAPGVGAGSQSGGAGGQTGGAGQTGGQPPPTQGAPGTMGQNPGQMSQEGTPQLTAPRGGPVVIEWESATPVRLAEAKLKAGGGQPSPADVEQAKKPADFYMVALIGVPGKPEEGEDQELAAAAMLTPKDKQSIPATSVKEQAMSGGGRALIFTFPKTQPITEDDKTVQFKLAKGPLPTEIKQNFKLKDMHYEGKLAL